ncbi:MAG TPA: S8 family serine peptidase, partial [Humisphaera sp.]
AALAGHASVREVIGAPRVSLIRPPRHAPAGDGANAAAAAADGETWGIRRLGVRELWDQGLTGAGVLVGHLDTGVDGAHPALGGAIRSFARFDDLGDQDPNPGLPFDTAWHGTHTAGTIAGRRVAGQPAFGVAPGAELASAIIIEGGDVVARILGGMDWAVEQGVRVLNMSLGLRGFTEDFLSLTQILRARNILPVFAVGNEGPGTSRSPGNYAEALSVGAIEEAEGDAMWPDSSSGRFVRDVDPIVPDLVAPGAAVLSSMPGGRFGLSWGTSMATPHVAGLAALLFEAAPDATASQVEAAILASCIRPASLSADRANRGVPDGPRALAALVPGRAAGVGKGGPGSTSGPPVSGGAGVSPPSPLAAPPSPAEHDERRHTRRGGKS